MVLRIYSTLFREHAFVKINRVFYNTVNNNDTIRSFIYYTDWKRTVWSEKIIKSNIVIALVFTIYYFVFNQMQLGLFHNIFIAIILYISFWYLSQAKEKQETKKNK